MTTYNICFQININRFIVQVKVKVRIKYNIIISSPFVYNIAFTYIQVYSTYTHFNYSKTEKVMKNNRSFSMSTFFLKRVGVNFTCRWCIDTTIKYKNQFTDKNNIKKTHETLDLYLYIFEIFLKRIMFIKRRFLCALPQSYFGLLSPHIPDWHVSKAWGRSKVSPRVIENWETWLYRAGGDPELIMHAGQMEIPCWKLAYQLYTHLLC